MMCSTQGRFSKQSRPKVVSKAHPIHSIRLTNLMFTLLNACNLFNHVIMFLFSHIKPMSSRKIFLQYNRFHCGDMSKQEIWTLSLSGKNTHTLNYENLQILISSTTVTCWLYIVTRLQDYTVFWSKNNKCQMFFDKTKKT